MERKTEKRLESCGKRSGGRMLSLKLVRSLVLGQTINQHPLRLSHDDATITHPHHQTMPKSTGAASADAKSPVLIFLPTKELVIDTYRLATIARDMGMDLHPTPSLSHIIFSHPSSSSSSPSPSSPLSLSSSTSTALWSSSSSSWSIPNDAVPLPFPSLAAAPFSHLRRFVSLTKGFFKLGFLDSNESASEIPSNWDCCSISLYSRLSGDRIDTMNAFSRALAGRGWTLFKTRQKPHSESAKCQFMGGNSMYLFRKVDYNRVRARRGNECCAATGESRIRELRLPQLNFRNAPLKILQYIRLMTDDIFYLA